MFNFYTIFILAVLIIKYALNLISNILNIRSIKPDIPKEFQEIYNKKAYNKSQKYNKERMKFSIIVTSFNFLFLILFWFLGGFNGVNILVTSLNLPFLLTGLLYVGIIYFLSTIINIPFQIYSIFVIEEKYGFNKTTVKTFFLDILKVFIISIVLGSIILLLIFAIFKYINTLAWLYVWFLVALFEIFVMFISPKIIAPMFNKFKPLEKGELRKAIFDYAKKVNYPLKNIFIMDGSKRSTKSNAFFMGFGKNKKIALFDTILDKHSIDEMVSILAHEIGHYKKKHILTHLIISILNLGLMFYLFSIFLNDYSFFNAFFVNEPYIYIGIVIFSFLYEPIDYILSIFTNTLFRKFEYQADYFAKQTTGSYKYLVKALKKLSLNNLGNLSPHPFYVFLKYNHPPVLKRIETLKKID